MFDVKQIHRDRYARCLQSILINCVTAEKKNNLLTTVATKSFESANVHDILFVRTSVEWVFSMPPVRDGYSSFRGGKKRSVRLNRCPNKRERFLGNVYNIHEILIFVEFLTL